MSKKILYFKESNFVSEDIIRSFENAGYVAVEYDGKMGKSSIGQILNDHFFYFVFSFGFLEEIYMACIETATKYVACISFNQKALYDRLCEEQLVNCYYVLQTEDIVNQIQALIFNDRELNIYHIINELHILHKNIGEPTVGLKELRYIDNKEEIISLTDNYFHRMELEKELSFQLKEQLMEYIDALLKKKTSDSWTEIVLWNRRHECLELSNGFWQFYLLQKIEAIYVEEKLQYYKSGEEPFVTKIGSFEEMSETYFHLLLLLRRLNYNVAPEEEIEIVNYIMEKDISGIFIRHVVEHNKIENKEKVYGRLEELLTKYE